MKKRVSFLILFFWVIGCFSQENISLFYPVENAVKSGLSLNLKADYTILDVDTDQWNDILTKRPETVKLKIPLGDRLLEVSLQEKELFKNGFQVRTASGLTLNMETESKSVFYQGTFFGYPKSHFALSVLNNEIIGIGSIPGIGDVNLGKLPGEDHYIFYAESALNGRNTFECHTNTEPVERPDVHHGDRALVEDCTGLYFEVDYDIFLAKGGVVESADFMMALFNEIQLLYELDGMTIYITDLMVWDEESPYYLEPDTGVLLNLFGTTTTVWDGDLGHLVTNSAGGGLAWVDVFCHPDQAIRKAVSGISLTFELVPIYSWSVEVIAHEMGHNMGSPHTHACFWNDDLTAIDGCGPEADFDEGCDAELPVEGGTVMSYCHLTDVGINLGLGFGPQPGELLRDNIIEAACLQSCDLQVMDVQVLHGDLGVTCENSPISRQVSVINNGNENMTYLTVKVYIDAVLTETFTWTGLILEGQEGVIYLPTFTLPLGTYTMDIVFEYPDGYEDENMADNSISFSFDVTPFPKASFWVESDELVSYNATTSMINETTGAVSYKWDMGDGSPIITGTNPEHTFPFEYGGYYEIDLFATSQFGCVDTANAFVTVQGVNIFYIPNTFTPDGDAFNQYFKPVFSANVDPYDYHFAVFNRFGEIMFESYNLALGWNGEYGDKGVVDDGVYVWILEFGDLTSDQKHKETGHVVVLR